MRVVAGEYGGRRLKSLDGDQTRPTSDKIKGSIFNMIGPYFNGGTVLDLFSGSGSLAIEAVSRGCDQAICVDKNSQAIKVIQANIEVTKETQKFKMLKADADQALTQLARQEKSFDYVFLDPPYAKQKIVVQIKRMLELNLIKPDGLIICEIDAHEKLPDELPGLSLSKRKNYGTTEVVIYER